MDASAYFGGASAGLFYLLVGIRLVRLSARTGQAPERLLGSSFLLWSLSYLCWQLPIANPDQPLAAPLFFVGRVLSYTATVLCAVFSRLVFRNQERWATGLVIGIAIGLSVGVAGSAAVGDWEGIRPLSNPWWWLECLVYSAAMAWIGVEGLVEYSKARQRRRLGLCDALVCNRYLLWGLAGVVWTLYAWVLAAQTVHFERNQAWSVSLDNLDGAIEFLAIAIVWIAFFPPAGYRRWLHGGIPVADTAKV